MSTPARLVAPPNLEISQRIPSFEKRRSENCYIVRGLKFRQQGYYIGYAAFLYSGLLEGMKDVTDYVPRPLRRQIGKTQFFPAFYTNGRLGRKIVDIRPGGVLPTRIEIPIREHLALHAYQFEILDPDAILEREQEALNWRHMVSCVIAAKNVPTQHHEAEVWDECLINPDDLAIGDFVQSANRAGTYLKQIAIYRLLLRNKLQADLTQSRINFSTRIQPCI